MKLCYSCDKLITKDNRSKEHLLQSALGGKKISYDLLCGSCNNKFGETIDAELISQIGHFADILGVNNSTKNKILKFQTDDLKDWSVGSRLKGLYTIKYEIKGYVLEVHGKDELECERKLKNILKKHKKKDASLDINKEISKIQFNDNYAPDKLFINNGRSKNPKEMVIGGTEGYYGGLAKIVLNYYLANGGEKKYVEDIVSFINNHNVKFNGIDTAYSDGIVRNLDKKEISHVIQIWSDMNNKVLVGYIELFSMFRYFIVLNFKYDGPEFNYKWAYDLIAKKDYDVCIAYYPEKLEKLPLEKVSIEMRKLHDRFSHIVESLQNEL